MTSGEDSRARARLTVQTYARVAGLLALVSVAAGGFGEAYAPSKLIVLDNAAATAQNIRAFDELFRVSFLAYLVEALCDVALALIFYVLLKPVSRGVSLLAAFLGLIGTTLFAVSEMFYFALPTLLMRDAAYLQTFSPDQLNALTLLSVKMFAFSSAMFTAFFGMAWILRAWLIILSGYLPKLIGALVLLGGLAFVARNVAFVLAPLYPSGQLLLAIMPGLLLLALWLLVMGVNVAKWETKAAEAAL
jgi:hypothetical protein